jgi:hypothetical protein
LNRIIYANGTYFSFVDCVDFAVIVPGGHAIESWIFGEHFLHGLKVLEEVHGYVEVVLGDDHALELEIDKHLIQCELEVSRYFEVALHVRGYVVAALVLVNGTEIRLLKTRNKNKSIKFSHSSISY